MGLHVLELSDDQGFSPRIKEFQKQLGLKGLEGSYRLPGVWAMAWSKALVHRADETLDNARKYGLHIYSTARDSI